MLRPGSFVSRLVALAILAIVLLAAWQFVAEPMLQTYRDNRERIARSKELLQRYEALIAQRPVLERRLASLDSIEGAEAAYLDGANEALAGVELQDFVSEVVDSAGGTVKSIQILPAIDVEDGPALRESGVKLRFGADIDSLAAALFELETMEPVLFVDRLQVGAARSRQRFRESEAAQELDVRLDVFGYARRAE